MFKNSIKGLFIITIALFALACGGNGPVQTTVTKTVDGDTIKVAYYNKTTNIRLAGVDTPETYNNRKAKKDIALCGVTKDVMFAHGKAAKAYVNKMYPVGSNITYKVIDVGVYGRPIAWIEPLNYKLVELGYARVMDYGNLPKDTIITLRNLEAVARAMNAGIWKDLNNCW